MKAQLIDGILHAEFDIVSTDVNKHKMLRPSRLFSIFEEAAGDHCNMAGLGTDRTRDRGIVWVLASEQVRINRMPRYEEHVILTTWPSKTRMGFFPRHYRIATPDGEILVESVSMWGLIDFNTRQLIKPEDYGIDISPVEVEGEMKMKGGPKPIEFASAAEFTVPFSYIDINGHLNNARYFDILDDIMPAAASGLEPVFINARYGTEALQDSTLTINWGSEDNCYYASIDENENNHFKLRIEYRK